MNQPSNPKEYLHQRISLRVPHAGNIIFKGRRGTNLEGSARDLSISGVYIVLSAKLSLGTEVLLYLPIEVQPEKIKMCIVAGKIVRIGSKKEEAGFAVRFEENLPAQTKEKLMSYISRMTPVKKP
jgi:Tfp pilus assembly protein PilZ